MAGLITTPFGATTTAMEVLEGIDFRNVKHRELSLHLSVYQEEKLFRDARCSSVEGVLVVVMCNCEHLAS